MSRVHKRVGKHAKKPDWATRPKPEDPRAGPGSRIWPCADPVTGSGQPKRWRAGPTLRIYKATHNSDRCLSLYTFSNDWLMMWQLCLNYFIETYDLIIEDSYHKPVMIDQQSCELEMLDTARQKYKELTEWWVRYDENFILVYSITSRPSFSDIMKFHEQFELMKECVVPVMLMSNKSDK